MDSTIFAGILGVVGSLLGAVVGFMLSNSKAKIKAYVDNQMVIYYLDNAFCMYLPVTIINEGSKSGTISDFKVKLEGNNQCWNLGWFYFSEDHTLKGGTWEDTRRASPILIHGNSGIQCPIKLIEISGDTTRAYSNVLLTGGELLITFEYFDRDSKMIESQKYSSELTTNVCEILNERRKDDESKETAIIPLRRYETSNKQVYRAEPFAYLKNYIGLVFK